MLHATGSLFARCQFAPVLAGKRITFSVVTFLGLLLFRFSDHQYLLVGKFHRYQHCFRQFIKHYDGIKPSQITRLQINDYLTQLIKERNISVSNQGQVMSAIKMFYASVIAQEDKINGLFQPKKPQKLPKVRTEEEVSALLRSVDNLKHRCLLMLIYAGGLRLGEVIALRLPDLQPEKERLFVRSGKGNKDRCTLLSVKAWEHLSNYLELYKPAQKLRKFIPITCPDFYRDHEKRLGENQKSAG